MIIPTPLQALRVALVALLIIGGTTVTFYTFRTYSANAANVDIVATMGLVWMCVAAIVMIFEAGCQKITDILNGS